MRKFHNEFQNKYMTSLHLLRMRPHNVLYKAVYADRKTAFLSKEYEGDTEHRGKIWRIIRFCVHDSPRILLALAYENYFPMHSFR